MTPPEIWIIAVGGTAVLVGAVIQGSVGFGLGLFASPIMVLLDPSLMPGSMLTVAAVLPMFILLREWRHIEWRGLAWAFLGRAAGSGLGVWLVWALPGRTLGAVVGVAVLIAVALTARTVYVPRNRVTLATGGLFSGALGTATAIGGPPIALVYQYARGPEIRATLAAFFCAGSILSLGSLAAVGQLPAGAVVAGLILIPFMVAGFLVSGPFRRYLDGGRIRAAVLVVAALAAVLLIVRSL